MDAFSGFALREDISELACLACGGHSDSADNRVTSIDLRSDSPTWVVRKASDWNGIEADVSHYASGSPVSRHTYRHNYWIPGINRYVTVGSRGSYINAYFFYNVDAFNPDTNTWDAAGTWPNVLGAASFGVVKDGSGAVWTTALKKLLANGAWSDPGVTGGTASLRTPVVYDSIRNQIVCIQWADGFNAGTAQVNASRVPLSGTTRIDITFNASAGLTQFQADTPGYAGADYCPDNDKILFFDGRTGKQGRFYWITPADSGNWDMEIATFGAGSSTIPVVPGAGVNGKLWYVPGLKGFVLMPIASAGLYFLRTA